MRRLGPALFAALAAHNRVAGCTISQYEKWGIPAIKSSPNRGVFWLDYRNTQSTANCDKKMAKSYRNYQRNSYCDKALAKRFENRQKLSQFHRDFRIAINHDTSPKEIYIFTELLQGSFDLSRKGSCWYNFSIRYLCDKRHYFGGYAFDARWNI